MLPPGVFLAVVLFVACLVELGFDFLLFLTDEFPEECFWIGLP